MKRLICYLEVFLWNIKSFMSQFCLIAGVVWRLVIPPEQKPVRGRSGVKYQALLLLVPNSWKLKSKFQQTSHHGLHKVELLPCLTEVERVLCECTNQVINCALLSFARPSKATPAKQAAGSKAATVNGGAASSIRTTRRSSAQSNCDTKEPLKVPVPAPQQIQPIIPAAGNRRDSSTSSSKTSCAGKSRKRSCSAVSVASSVSSAAPTCSSAPQHKKATAHSKTRSSLEALHTNTESDSGAEINRNKASLRSNTKVQLWSGLPYYPPAHPGSLSVPAFSIPASTPKQKTAKEHKTRGAVEKQYPLSRGKGKAKAKLSVQGSSTQDTPLDYTVPRKRARSSLTVPSSAGAAAVTGTTCKKGGKRKTSAAKASTTTIGAGPKAAGRRKLREKKTGSCASSRYCYCQPL